MKKLGPSVYDEMKQHRLDLNQAMELAKQAVRFKFNFQLVALENMHNMGYSHCDLKPNNILFDQGTSLKDIWDGQCLSLIDFGLSVPSSSSLAIKMNSCK